MTLLTEVMERPLDPGYRDAADRKAAAGYEPPRAGRRVLIVLLAVALGAATTTAAVYLRAPEPAVLAARTLLEHQIKDRTATAADLRDQNQKLSEQIAALQATALAAEDPGLLAVLKRDSVAAGASAVEGPGLRITLSDAPADASGTVEADNRVQDVDLQIVVNALWSSGAEAIAINGQRLTTLTAIRSAGSAILVDLVPLSGPYVVEAVGDPVLMQTRFARTPASPRLAWLRTTWGIGAEVSSRKELSLPGSGSVTLRYAETTQASGPTARATATSSVPTGSTSGVASSDSVSGATPDPGASAGPEGGTK